jgi:hypothetical protein
MISAAEAAKMAASMPDVTEDERYGNRTWFVGKNGFAWERPFRKADLKRFGDAPVPGGPIFAVRVADLRTKQAVLGQGERGVFTIPHFDNYPAVLVQLDAVARPVLQRLIADAWLACSPPSTTSGYRVRARKRRG